MSNALCLMNRLQDPEGRLKTFIHIKLFVKANTDANDQFEGLAMSLADKNRSWKISRDRSRRQFIR